MVVIGNAQCISKICDQLSTSCYVHSLTVLYTSLNLTDMFSNTILCICYNFFFSQKIPGSSFRQIRPLLLLRGADFTEDQ